MKVTFCAFIVVCLFISLEAGVRRTRQACTPGTSWDAPDGCNTCFCSDNGHVSCTLMGCGPIYPITTTPACTPGTSWDAPDGCNKCFCSDNGRVGCTLMGCEPIYVTDNTPTLEVTTEELLDIE